MLAERDVAGLPDRWSVALLGGVVAGMAAGVAFIPIAWIAWLCLLWLAIMVPYFIRCCRLHADLRFASSLAAYPHEEWPARIIDYRKDGRI